MPSKPPLPTAKSPGQIVTEQIRRHRMRLELSQSNLAQRMTELGIPMHQTTVAKVENAERKVSVDELLLFAVALGVPPGILMFGLGVEREVALTPTEVHRADSAHQWLEGNAHLRGAAADWHTAQRPIAMLHQHRTLVEAVSQATANQKRADFVGDEKAAAEARSALASALLELADHRDMMRSDGMEPPELTRRDWIQALKKLGREV